MQKIKWSNCVHETEWRSSLQRVEIGTFFYDLRELCELFCFHFTYSFFFEIEWMRASVAIEDFSHKIENDFEAMTSNCYSTYLTAAIKICSLAAINLILIFLTLPLYATEMYIADAKGDEKLLRDENLFRPFSERKSSFKKLLNQKR